MKFSNLNRQQIKNRLKGEQYDVLIIGGGITGAGIAFDAASRGMKTALVEMQDFAAGTSSRSTKLVHGGLRYLKQFEISMVAEVGKERGIVYENGPHVTKPQSMLLPIYKEGTFGLFSTSIGLKLYDFLAKVNKGERHKMLSAEETIKKEPLIKKLGLLGGGYYVEYRTDDARLTIEVMKAAFNLGAISINYTKVMELVYDQGKVAGAIVQDVISGERYSVHAKHVVNAAGPWVDTIREMDDSKKGKTLQLSKGTHLVFDQSCFPLSQAIYFDTLDGRMMFAIPRDNKTYVGTTDTFYHEDPSNPYMTTNDRNYIIHAIHDMFPEVNITESDVESSWAGVRPLIYEEGKKPSQISRKDEIWEAPSGLITMAGGKLTGYRKMAETIVDRLAEKLILEKGNGYPACQTKRLPISGGDVGGPARFESYIKGKIPNGIEAGLTSDEAEQLTRIYGSNIETVLNLLNRNRDDAEKYGLPLFLFAKLVYGMEEELVATPIDFFYRRTGALLFHIDLVSQWRKQVISYMEEKFNWTVQEKRNQSLLLDGVIKATIHPSEE